MQVFAFYITAPNGLQRLVFVRGTDYGNAFGKARRHAGFSGSTVRGGHLGENPATEAKDAREAAGSLMLDEVSPGGNVISFGTTTGAGSLAQTNFFEGGGGAKVMASPLGEPGGDAPPPPGGPSGPIIGTEDFGDLYPSFQAGLGERGIGIGPGSGVRGQLADAAFRNLQSRGFLDLGLNALPGRVDTSEWADKGPTQEQIEAAAGPTFQEFARTRGLYGGAGAADALGLFNRAVELSKNRLPGFGEADEFGERTNRFTDFNTTGYDDAMNAVQAAKTGGNPLTGTFLNPTQDRAEHLARVAREAGRSRFGFASGFLPSAQQLSSSYFAQPQEGAMNFADFLNRRIFGT